MNSREDCLIAVAELYRRPLSSIAVDMFLAATADLDDEEFLFGLGRCCKCCKFMPTPSEVIDAAQPLVHCNNNRHRQLASTSRREAAQRERQAFVEASGENLADQFRRARQANGAIP